MNSTTPSEHSNEAEVFQDIFVEFRKRWVVALDLYDTTTVVLMCFGTVGGIMALSTLISSKRMHTPSFFYHRILIVAKLIYCFNWFVVRFIDRKLAVKGIRKQFVFSGSFTAFYSGIISRFVYSTCGYMVLYETLYIALDRVLALCCPVRYKSFNNKRVSKGLIYLAFLLSAFLHSWSTWVESRVQEVNIPPNITLYTWIRGNSLLPKSLLTAKNIFNGTIRIAYPIVLTILTAVACWSFLKRSRSRSRLTGHISGSSMQEALRRYRKQKKRERCLFYLMISVVVLSYVQVLPAEAKRILEIVYPIKKISKIIDNRNMSLEHRVKMFYLALYGHEISPIFINFCTTIERCLTFYLYFCLNPSFRKETFIFLRGCVDKCPGSKVFCRCCNRVQLHGHSTLPRYDTVTQVNGGRSTAVDERNFRMRLISRTERHSCSSAGQRHSLPSLVPTESDNLLGQLVLLAPPSPSMTPSTMSSMGTRTQSNASEISHVESQL